MEASHECETHQRVIASALNLCSTSPPMGHSSILVYIRAIHIFRISPYAGAFVTADLVHDSPIDKLSQSRLYMSPGANDFDDLVSGQILYPQWIDGDLPSRWKESCTNLHDGHCKENLVSVCSSMRPSWLVDIQKQCIVPAPESCSYVALSYVWGEEKMLLALESNHDLLQQPGSLAKTTWKPPLPRTLKDAMGVVGLLGERYLWVDSLCIVQDDKSEKATALSDMCGIYANASLTIIAMQGKNANSGLKGLHEISTPRSLKKVIHKFVRGMTVIQHPVRGKFPYSRSQDSVWNTRAWTFQEHLFSRRRLIFDHDSIRWECAGAVWQKYAERSTRFNATDLITYFQSLIGARVPDFHAFTMIVQKYNCRDLTYPEDALDAFAGITSAMSLPFGGNLISGLPVAWFDIALLWSPVSFVSRRVEKGSSGKKCPPSWSWAGWSGEVQMDVASASDFLKNSPRAWYWMDNSARSTLLVSWKYHNKVDSPGVEIQPTILRSREKWLEGRAQQTSEWTKHPISESPSSIYEARVCSPLPSYFFKHSEIPEFEFWFPIPLLQWGTTCSAINPSYISCNTHRAGVFPAERIEQSSSERPSFSLRDRDGNWIGVLEPLVGVEMSGARMDEQYLKVELVEVAQGSFLSAFPPYPWLHEAHYPGRPKEGTWYSYY